MKRAWTCFKVGILCVFLCVMGTGCGRANAKLPAGFFSKKGSVGVVWSTHSQQGEFYRVGAQGLLDQAVNNLTSGPLPDRIHKVDLVPLVDKYYLQKYGEGFEKKNIQAKLVKLPLEKKNLKSFSASGDQLFWLDFSEYKKQFGLDYVVYLDITEFGVEQNYYGVIATSGPQGHIKMDVFLVDTTTNKLVGEYHLTRSLDPSGPWDNPPDYPVMVKAVEDVVSSALQESYFHFFN